MWKSSSLTESDAAFTATVQKPEEGWKAYMVELTFDIGASHPLKLTTPVTVIPDTLPFAAPNPPRPTGFLAQ